MSFSVGAKGLPSFTIFYMHLEWCCVFHFSKDGCGCVKFGDFTDVQGWKQRTAAKRDPVRMGTPVYWRLEQAR